MAKLWLIQRGTFNIAGDPQKGLDGVIHYDYMGSAEFEWRALPKAYRRLMYHYTNYDVFHTGVYTLYDEELMVYCRKEYAHLVIQTIRNYVYEPYEIKEMSDLEKVLYAEDSLHDGRHTNFWWCIDNKSCGNWMAFMQSNERLFRVAVGNDFLRWWMPKSTEEREKEYKDAQRS